MSGWWQVRQVDGPIITRCKTREEAERRRDQMEGDISGLVVEPSNANPDNPVLLQHPLDRP